MDNQEVNYFFRPVSVHLTFTF